MKFPVEELIKLTVEINGLVEKGSFEEAYQKFSQIESDLEADRYSISEKNSNDRETVAEFYANFAYFLFSMSEYGLFFENFIKAQKYGYPAEKKRNFIYEAFVEPNFKEFEANYLLNLDYICSDYKPLFEQLTYWLITTGNENEYYLYNKKTDYIEEKVYLTVDLQKNIQTSINSDIYLANMGSWNSVKKCLERVGNTSKIVYIITTDIEKLFSYFQGIIPDADLFSRLVVFTEWSQSEVFFKKTGSFFPHNYVGDLKSQENYLKHKKQIHEFRLEKTNRTYDRILLSICIPSYNRGHRAYENVLNCLASEFDQEIEVIVSNNGTRNDTEDYYKKIMEINDSRLTYFSFEENKGMALNICKVVEIARGEFVLLLSDEDLIDHDKLKDLISVLRENKEDVGIVRVRSDKQGLIPYVGFVKPGIEALRKFMLSSNYLSGNIYYRKKLINNNLIEFIKNNLDNETCFYYPHMVWEIKLAQCSGVLGLDIVLVREGRAEKTEFINSSIGESIQKKIPYYVLVIS